MSHTLQDGDTRHSRAYLVVLTNGDIRMSEKYENRKEKNHGDNSNNGITMR